MGQFVRFGVASSLAALAAAVACSVTRDLDPSPPVLGSAPELILEVQTAIVRSGAISQRVFAPGSLRARRESHIGSEVRGRIEEIFVRAGDRIEAGAPLFQIDRANYLIALRQAEAGLDLARAERRQRDADLKRLAALRGQSIVPEEDVDRAQTGLAVARARERQAAEVVALARHNLEQTQVLAPFAGSIAARLVDEGTTALVQPQTIVVILQETAELEAHADLPESELAIVRVGDPVQIHVEGFAEPIHSEVSAVSDTVDPATRTYRVRMRVPNPDHRLKAGVFARVEIEPQPKRDVLLVPREAIRSTDSRTRVLVVRDGRAVAVPVSLGLVSQSEVEVLSGLAVGARVIVGEAAREIAPDMRVRAAATGMGQESKS